MKIQRLIDNWYLSDWINKNPIWHKENSMDIKDLELKYEIGWNLWNYYKYKYNEIKFL